MIVDTSVYKGDINTSAIYLDPPDELKGKINVATGNERRHQLRHHVRRRRTLHH